MTGYDRIPTGEPPYWLHGLEEAASGGDLNSTLTLRQCYLEGVCGLEADMDQALRYTELAAQQGDPRSMYHTAVVLYSQGRFEMAARWMRRAYRAGIMEASFGLARMYAYGRGVDQDLEKAEDYVREAGELGIEPDQQPVLEAFIEQALARHDWQAGNRPRAMRRLEALEVPEARMQLAAWDWPHRRQHLEKAADLGSAQAMYELAGLETDPRQIFRQLKNAAKAGCRQAMSPLAACYRTGFGVHENREEADRWLKQAAAAGAD